MGNNVNSAGKILLIATGGTIACRETGHGLMPVLDGEGLLRELPELSGVCGVEVLDLMQRDSTDITADDRMQMARAVWENRGAYDGFVSRFSRINRHPVSNSGQFRIRCRIMPEFAADDGVHIFPAVQKSSEVDFCFPDKTPRHPAWFGNGVESALKVVVPA